MDMRRAIVVVDDAVLAGAVAMIATLFREL